MGAGDIEVKVAPPTLYYAQADGTHFKDSAWFGWEMEKKAGFRNLIADFIKPGAGDAARLEDPDKKFLPMWRVDKDGNADAKGIAVIAPGGLNGSAEAEFSTDDDRNKAADALGAWFWEPAVTIDDKGVGYLGTGKKTTHRAHLVVLSSHGWLAGYCGGDLPKQKKWWLVGDVAKRGVGFRGPLWVILAQCSTLNSATWPSWAKILMNSSPHVRGILGYEEVAPGARVAAAIGQNFVTSLKAGKTFLEAWKERNTGNNWAAIVHKDAVGDKLKDLPKLVASNAKFASVQTTDSVFSYYGYLKNVGGGKQQEIYLKAPPFKLGVNTTGSKAAGAVDASTLASAQAYLINGDKLADRRHVVTVEAITTDPAKEAKIDSLTLEWIHIRPTKIRLDMTKVFETPTVSPAAKVTASKATFSVDVETPAKKVEVTFKVQPKSVLSAVATDDQSYHKDDKLVPHHSYIYLRVTVKLEGGTSLNHDFMTEGLSWYGFF